MRQCPPGTDGEEQEGRKLRLGRGARWREEDEGEEEREEGREEEEDEEEREEEEDDNESIERGWFFFLVPSRGLLSYRREIRGGWLRWRNASFPSLDAVIREEEGGEAEEVFSCWLGSKGSADEGGDGTREGMRMIQEAGEEEGREEEEDEGDMWERREEFKEDKTCLLSVRRREEEEENEETEDEENEDDEEEETRGEEGRDRLCVYFLWELDTESEGEEETNGIAVGKRVLGEHDALSKVGRSFSGGDVETPSLGWKGPLRRDRTAAGDTREDTEPGVEEWRAEEEEKDKEERECWEEEEEGGRLDRRGVEGEDERKEKGTSMEFDKGAEDVFERKETALTAGGEEEEADEEDERSKNGGGDPSDFFFRVRASRTWEKRKERQRRSEQQEEDGEKDPIGRNILLLDRGDTFCISPSFFFSLSLAIGKRTYLYIYVI